MKAGVLSPFDPIVIAKIYDVWDLLAAAYTSIRVNLVHGAEEWSQDT
jgi:hypothetical protein